MMKIERRGIMQTVRKWILDRMKYKRKYGLDRMSALMSLLGNPQDEYPIIHVTGTNGKGSTATFLENIFLVIAATDDEVLNKNISQLCMSKNILVNNITSKDDMNVRFASIYEKDDIQIAISANGNPKKAVEIKHKIKDIFEK